MTGANAGLGKEIANILYAKNATVYVAARSEQKAQSAILDIRTQNPTSSGTLKFLLLDLSDLRSCSRAADAFLAAESRLDVLFNNAGVPLQPQGSKTAQGYELQLGTNCLGHSLVTRKLVPLLGATARFAPEGSVRVLWVSSSAAEAGAPAEGVPLDNLDYHVDKSAMFKYSVSKAGNYFRAMEFAKRCREDGIISVASIPSDRREKTVRLTVL